MRTRNHNWFDTSTGKTLYSFQVFSQAKWRHAAEDNKPCIFATPQARDAKRKEFRAQKERNGRLAMPRDAYDVQAEHIATLSAQLVHMTTMVTACGVERDALRASVRTVIKHRAGFAGREIIGEAGSEALDELAAWLVTP